MLHADERDFIFQIIIKWETYHRVAPSFFTNVANKDGRLGREVLKSINELQRCD